MRAFLILLTVTLFSCGELDLSEDITNPPLIIAKTVMEELMDSMDKEEKQDMEQLVETFARKSKATFVIIPNKN